MNTSPLLVASIFFLVSITVVFATTKNYDPFKITQTEYGALRGKLMGTLYDHKPYYSYRGIPYAAPPMNELRFKLPVAPVPWSNVLDTFAYGNECVQKNFFGNTMGGSEDCLYLNVFTPAVKSIEKLLVMIFIHGGAYYGGSANGYQPDLLLNSDDVIIVTINYRIGAFGFLSLGTAEYSGNMGLKDQLFALQWVQRNIEQFGGDKNLVTLFGESAGSACTHFHVLSPKSQGLFKRAIMQSGTAISPWSLYSKSNHLDTIYELARKFGHNPQNVNDLIGFLHRVDSTLLIQETTPLLYVPGSVRKDSELIWAPIVEAKEAIEPFLTKHPHEYLADTTVKQSIDTMHGYCADEMIFLTISEILNVTMLAAFEDKFEISLPRTDLKSDYASKDYQNMAQEIRDFYFSKSNGKITYETAIKFNDLMSDIWFVYGTDQSVKSQIKRTTGNVFYYLFSLDTRLGLLKLGFPMFPQLDFTAASHGDDLFYVFNLDFPGTKINEIYESLSDDSIERKLIQTMTKLWTNFAKYGNPTPNADPIDFKPVRQDAVNFVDITNDGLIDGVQPMADRIEFWNRFYQKYERTLKNIVPMIKDEL